MKVLFVPLGVLAVIFLVLASGVASKEEGAIQALMITGGCCHDYEAQKEILSVGISERSEREIDWTILHEGGDARDHRVSVYGEEDWASGYDIVLHNECFGGVEDAAFVDKMVEGHKGTPAVVLHCTMHSYRNAPTERWRDLLGVKSMRHWKKRPITVVPLEPDHPVMKGYPAGHTTPEGELYEVIEVRESCTPLATGKTDVGQEEICVWVNDFEGTRVFGTTLGHHNSTMSEDEYLDLVTRGFLWGLGGSAN
ncbi:MAG: ThuA domain-containing protein [Verrucomicrobiota bacterium]